MSLLVNILLGFIAVLFMLLWLKERKHASEAEVVAYGLRSQDDSDDNTKTSITVMETEYNEAIEKLKELKEIKQDEWGRWVWTKTGLPLGSDDF